MVNGIVKLRKFWVSNLFLEEVGRRMKERLNFDPTSPFYNLYYIN